MRLVREGVLATLDFINFGICVDCIKGKQLKHNEKGATHSKELLEVIHTDICEQFPPCITGGKYFITFIDDYS